MARWYSNPGQPDSEKKSNHHVRQPRLLFRMKEASCHVWWQPDCKTHPSFDARQLFSLKPTFFVGDQIKSEMRWLKIWRQSFSQGKAKLRSSSFPIYLTTNLFVSLHNFFFKTRIWKICSHTHTFLFLRK